jgi:hypothetical protein
MGGCIACCWGAKKVRQEMDSKLNTKFKPELLERIIVAAAY